MITMFSYINHDKLSQSNDINYQFFKVQLLKVRKVFFGSLNFEESFKPRVRMKSELKTL